MARLIAQQFFPNLVASEMSEGGQSVYEVEKGPQFDSLCQFLYQVSVFCWLGHLKVSFYCPTSHRGQVTVSLDPIVF